MLHYSSLLFLSNALHALITSHYWFLAMFVVLTATSFFWHSHWFDYPILWWIDHLAVYATIATCGYFCFYTMCMLRVLAITLVLCIGGIYYYLERKVEPDTANELHVLMHVLACVALHIVVITSKQ